LREASVRVSGKRLKARSAQLLKWSLVASNFLIKYKKAKEHRMLKPTSVAIRENLHRKKKRRLRLHSRSVNAKNVEEVL
jgi:hypothetical protein